MMVIKDAWYIALPSRKLRTQPIQRNVEGHSIVLFRDDNGKPLALIDKCLHRGMLLSDGHVENGCIRCPYHGWEYDGQGQVVKVPALGDSHNGSSVHTTRAYPVCEQDGHVWIWLGEKQPSCKPFHFPHYGDKGWNTFFMYTRFHAPVEACLENFLDVPHTIFVHPGLFRNDEQTSTRVRVTRKKESVMADFLDEPILQGIGPRICLPKGARMHHTDQFILPSISRVDYDFGDSDGFIITSQCTQLSEMVVDVTTAITWRLRLPDFIGHTFLRPYCRLVINQDVRLLEKLGKQIDKYGVTTLDTPADLLGSHITALRTAAMNNEQPVPMDAYETTLSI